MTPFVAQDLTIDHIVYQLIEITEKSHTLMWEMNEMVNYVDYLYKSKIDGNKYIYFRVYKYKSGNKCYLNVYLKDKNSYTHIIASDNYDESFKLIKTIENSKTFYNKLVY